MTLQKGMTQMKRVAILIALEVIRRLLKKL